MQHFLEPDITANELKLKNSSDFWMFFISCFCIWHHKYIFCTCVFTPSNCMRAGASWGLLLAACYYPEFYCDTKWRTIAAFFPPLLFSTAGIQKIKQNNFCREWSWNQLKCLSTAVRVTLRRRSPAASCYPMLAKWTWCHTLQPVMLDFVAAPDLVRMQPSHGCFVLFFNSIFE